MPNYEEMYFTLFNKVSEIIEDLKNVQSEMEEMCINNGEEKNK